MTHDETNGEYVVKLTRALFVDGDGAAYDTMYDAMAAVRRKYGKMTVRRRDMSVAELAVEFWAYPTVRELRADDRSRAVRIVERPV